MKRYLTPQLLRDTADGLCSGAFRHDGEEFMCIKVTNLNKFALKAFLILIRNAGIESTNGTLFIVGSADDRRYVDIAMPIRFMFLEFLALYLEDEIDEEIFWGATA
jgi:hypothetical protein